MIWGACLFRRRSLVVKTKSTGILARLKHSSVSLHTDCCSHVMGRAAKLSSRDVTHSKTLKFTSAHSSVPSFARALAQRTHSPHTQPRAPAPAKPTPTHRRVSTAYPNHAGPTEKRLAAATVY